VGHQEPLQVNTGPINAEYEPMRSRNGSRVEVSSDDGELENWLHDLTDGETTARQLRIRLDADGPRHDDSCAVCDGAATGKIYFGPEGHLHGRLSA